MTKSNVWIILCAVLLLTACQTNGDSAMETPNKTNLIYPLPLVIAHRGARSLAPENTLLAAQKAFALGADMWELDVAMTNDGVLVVIHDDTLTRTSDAESVFPTRKPWNVSSFSLAELRQLDFGTWFIEDDPFGTIKSGEVPTGDLEQMKHIQIPTLEEALTYTKDHLWRVNIELKDLTGTPGDSVVVEKVIALVEKLDLTERVIISSFNHAYLEQVKSINPTIVTATLVNQSVKDPIALVKNLNSQAFNPGIKTLSDLTSIQQLRDAGLDVYVWTVNDEPTMRKLIEAGVSGIFTDYPQLLLKVVKEYQ